MMSLRTKTLLALLAAVQFSTADEISLTWGMALKTGEEIITASYEGEVVSTSCSSKLTIAGIDIVVKSDTEAMGTLTVGDQIYELDNDELCSGFWNENFAEIVCTVPWQGAHTIPQRRVAIGTHDCFAAPEEQDLLPFIGEDGEPIDEQLASKEEERTTVEDSPEDEAGNSDETSSPDPGVVARQCLRATIKANPVNPRKWRRHVQLTATNNCGKDGGCSTSISTSRSVTHGASLSSNTGSWINAGLNVSKSRSSSTSYTCSATAGQKVCVKNWRRYQQYDVLLITACEWSSLPDQRFNIRSPMTDSRHTEYYCARSSSSCKGNSYTTWENRGQGYHGGAR